MKSWTRTSGSGSPPRRSDASAPDPDGDPRRRYPGHPRRRGGPPGAHHRDGRPAWPARLAPPRRRGRRECRRPPPCLTEGRPGSHAAHAGDLPGVWLGRAIPRRPEPRYGRQAPSVTDRSLQGGPSPRPRRLQCRGGRREPAPGHPALPGDPAVRPAHPGARPGAPECGPWNTDGRPGAGGVG
jgi:hypothetical protein